MLYSHGHKDLCDYLSYYRAWRRLTRASWQCQLSRNNAARAAPRLELYFTQWRDVSCPEKISQTTHPWTSERHAQPGQILVGGLISCPWRTDPASDDLLRDIYWPEVLYWRLVRRSSRLTHTKRAQICIKPKTPHPLMISALRSRAGPAEPRMCHELKATFPQDTKFLAT